MKEKRADGILARVKGMTNLVKGAQHSDMQRLEEPFSPSFLSLSFFITFPYSVCFLVPRVLFEYESLPSL